MAFYVKLGHRGLIFRLGTLIIGVSGSFIYWRASRLRARLPHPMPIPIRIHDPGRDE